MLIIDHIFSIFLDRKIKISQRFAIGIGILLVIIIINNVFGITYYYTSNKKIKQLIDINTLLKDTSVSLEVKAYLLSTEKKTLKRKTILDHIGNVFMNYIPRKDKRIFILHLITSGLPFFFGLIVYLSLLFHRDSYSSYDDFFEMLVLISTTSVVYLILSLIFAKLFYFIPVINDQPLWNYFINSILSSYIVSLFFRIDR